MIIYNLIKKRCERFNNIINKYNELNYKKEFNIISKYFTINLIEKNDI